MNLVEPSKNYTSSKIICSVNEIAVICHDDTIEISCDDIPTKKIEDNSCHTDDPEAMTNLDTQSDISEKGGTTDNIKLEKIYSEQDDPYIHKIKNFNDQYDYKKRFKSDIEKT